MSITARKMCTDAHVFTKLLVCMKNNIKSLTYTRYYRVADE